MQIFLIPLIVMVLVQGVFPFSILQLSGVKSRLEDNAVSMDRRIIENRQVVLENEMIQKWSSVYEESDSLDQVLETTLEQHGVDMDGFLESEEIQQAYLTQVFPELMLSLQRNESSGLFLILANDQPLDQPASYQGFFIRDSDPRTKTANNTDLLLERGNKLLARTGSLSLDNPWSTNFQFEGKGSRSCDDFFYEPYLAALEHPDVNMINLGYWAKPFVLEDHYMDNHRMITYSVPLIYEGTVYGVVGVEISENYLADYFPVKDLDQNLNAGYALICETDDGQYEMISGKGLLFDTVNREGKTFWLDPQEIQGLYQVRDIVSGKQKVYAMMSDLDLYSNNVPYEGTSWKLCGFVTENSIYEMGNTLYSGFLLMVVICALISLVAAILVVNRITRPFYRLVDSVRGGVDGIHAFRPSRIQELDELHQVIENMTDAQSEAEEQLKEEKERYRVAVESSKDVFFTYHMEAKMLEIVNSGQTDGIWDCKKHPEYLSNREVFPADRQRILDAVKNMEGTVNVEFRLYSQEAAKYVWYNLFVSLVEGGEGYSSRMVGCLHDINEQKLLELAQNKDKLIDSITSFFRLEAGLEAIQIAMNRNPKGVFALLDLGGFTVITKQYGMTLGDVLLEQLSGILTLQCRLRRIQAVFVRAGEDEILTWFPEVDAEQAKMILRCVKKDYAGMVHHDALNLNFSCGLTEVEDEIPMELMLVQVKKAVSIAKYKNVNAIVYQELTDKEKQLDVHFEFGEILSPGYMKQMSLVSLALNLFDRGGAIPVILDLLVVKLQEQYHFSNLLITRYSRDNMVSLLEYEWKQGREKRPQMVHCTEADYQEFLRQKEERDVQVIGEPMLHNRMFRAYLQGEDGIAIHMMDNGKYSGTILFTGMSSALYENKAERKTLGEIGTIIQNRINQEKHDLSAQAKSDFLARMSHEIRTPMNGIMGMTEIALREDQTEERKVDCLQKIKASSTYLLGLINDILDMSKIESGKMHLVESEFDLQKILPELQVLIGSKILEKDLKYEQEISLQHAWFCGDELRLRQVLINLLGNAIKYTNAGGYVVLEVTEYPLDEQYSEVYFAVADDGIGIDPENQERIFQSFEQVKNADTVKREGTGLGLAISNRLIHLMGSSIQLKSIPGQGSIFSFTLKLKRADEQKAEAELTTEQSSLKGKRILAAEDNELNREIICTILEEQGILVDAVPDGLAAVSQMADSQPGYYDMILMDIMMPVMNGLEAAREIRKLDREDCQTIPIVAMSANAFAEDVKKSLESGMNAHLSKPLDVKKLEETLHRYLG